VPRTGTRIQCPDLRERSTLRLGTRSGGQSRLGSLLWVDRTIDRLNKLREQVEEHGRLSEEWRCLSYERRLSDENADQRPRQASDTRQLHRG